VLVFAGGENDGENYDARITEYSLSLDNLFVLVNFLA
jgi:hypothetical protein